MNPYYPVFLNIQGRKCVVVGGGQVALRKVRSLIEHGAEVVVISPALCARLREMAAHRRIAVRNRDYRAGDLTGACIAIAATSKKRTNARVAAEAGRKGIPVNVTDDPLLSGFIVPSTVFRGDVAIAISTGGKSPALARKIRTELEKALPREYAELAELASEARNDVARKGLAVDAAQWQKALDTRRLIDLLRKGKRKQAKAILLDSLAGRERDTA